MAENTQSTVSLETLAPELQLRIFRFLQMTDRFLPSILEATAAGGYIHPKEECTDLRSLCLVSKRVYSSASVALHEHVDGPSSTRSVAGSLDWLYRLAVCLLRPSSIRRFEHTKTLSLALDLARPNEAAALELLSPLPNIHTLCLKLANPSWSHLDALQTYLTKSSNIRTVLLVDWREGSAEVARHLVPGGFRLALSLLRLLASMPSIQNLYLRTPRWCIRAQLPISQPRDQTAELIRAPLDYIRLTIPCLTVGNQAGWIMPYVTSTSIRHLRLDDESYDDPDLDIFDGTQTPPTFHHILNTNPFPNLEVLDISLGSAEVASSPDLTQLPRLSKLHLRFQASEETEKQLCSQLPRSIRHILWWFPPTKAFRLLADLISNASSKGVVLESVYIDPVEPCEWISREDPVKRDQFLASLVDLEEAAALYGVKLMPASLRQIHLEMEAGVSRGEHVTIGLVLSARKQLA